MNQDAAEKVEAVRKAAAKGNAYAKFQVGFIYEYGKGVHPDMDEAMISDSSTPSPYNKGSQSFVADGIAVKTSNDAFWQDETKLSTDLIRFGGGDAQIRTHSSDDGSGSIAITWQSPSRWEVDRVGFTELLVVEYSNPQSQPMACAIIRSASLLDEVANITVTNINMAAKKPYAVVRNVYGNERNIRVHDFATRDGGRVEAITRKYVEIIELLPNSTRGWRESLIRLPLAGTHATKSD